MGTPIDCDENIFLTGLALEILNGITFNIYGQKQDFLKVITSDNSQEEEEEVNSQEFYKTMKERIDQAFQLELKTSDYRKQKFLDRFPADSNCDILEGKFFEIEKRKIQEQCKSLLEEIEVLQTQFKELNRMKKITENLEIISTQYWSNNNSSS